MINSSTIARPYAKAVFATACETHTLADWDGVLEVLRQIIEDELVAPLLRHPALTSRDWEQLLLTICEQVVPHAMRQISTQMANFLALLMEAKRLAVLGEIARVFHELRLKEEGVVEVDVFSPFPLTDQQQDNFQRVLKNYFGDVTIRLHSRIDTSLIGGAVLRAGDWVMDGSVKRKLARLQRCVS